MVKPMFQNKGFTLIEMLLVISIILTLSVLSFPLFINEGEMVVISTAEGKYSGRA